MHSFLHSFYQATLCGEGNNDHLGRWLTSIDFVLTKTSEAVSKFRELRQENRKCPEYTWLEAAATSALQKCEHYHNLVDDSAAYYAAEVLQPTRKWTWLEQKWELDPEKEFRLDSAKEAVQVLWEEEYKGKINVPQLTTVPSRPRQRDQAARCLDDEFGSLAEYRKVSSEPFTAHRDPFEAYIYSGPEVLVEDDPLEYWNYRIRSQPDLARFALDMLALPVSSAECERVFSSAKLLITDRRSRLKPDIIEANECLKAWLRDESAGQNRQRSVHEGAEEIDWGNGDETDEDGSENDEYDDDSDDDSDGEFGDEEHGDGESQVIILE